MTNKDIATFMLSEATGLDLIDLLLLARGIDDILLVDHRLEEEITCDQALEALCRWNQKKARIFHSITRLAPNALAPGDLS